MGRIKEGAVTRYTSPDGYRFYFDADEQDAGYVRRCETCGVWPDEEAHRCTPEQRHADTMERIRANIYRIGRPKGTSPR